MKASASTLLPLSPGVWLGLGLGGFFDGIVLHQVLQWHHLLTSAGYPADSLRNLEINTLWDGVFHMATWVFVAVGVALLWRQLRRRATVFSGARFAGSMLVGWGSFNLVEGLLNHHLLGLHHVNETVARSAWIWWDLGFLLWGAAMLAGGLRLCRSGGGASARA